jgi:hypothetical protein
MLYLSTESPENLAESNSDLIRFERIKDGEPRASALKYPERWYVGSKSGCSCTLRHLASIELGFGEPVEWAPEEEDDILATAEMYRTLARLISDGYAVDSLDLWVGMERGEVKSLVVDMKTVPEGAFRFFENHHFVFEG